MDPAGNGHKVTAEELDQVWRRHMDAVRALDAIWPDFRDALLTDEESDESLVDAWCDGNAEVRESLVELQRLIMVRGDEAGFTDD